MTNKQTHNAEKQPLHYSCTKEHSTLQQAAIHGDSERTKELISVYDPKANDSYALRLAAEHGQIECVKLLIPVSDPKAKDSEALLMAVRYGYEDIVKLLIPVSDPKANDSMALTWAVRRGDKQCILPLIPVSDLSWVFNNMRNRDVSTIHSRGVVFEVDASYWLMPMRKHCQRYDTRSECYTSAL